MGKPEPSKSHRHLSIIATTHGSWTESIAMGYPSYLQFNAYYLCPMLINGMYRYISKQNNMAKFLK